MWMRGRKWQYSVGLEAGTRKIYSRDDLILTGTVIESVRNDYGRVNYLVRHPDNTEHVYRFEDLKPCKSSQKAA